MGLCGAARRRVSRATTAGLCGAAGAAISAAPPTGATGRRNRRALLSGLGRCEAEGFGEQRVGAFARREIVADRQHHDLVDPIGLGERGELYPNLRRGADNLAAAMAFDLPPFTFPATIRQRIF